MSQCQIQVKNRHLMDLDDEQLGAKNSNLLNKFESFENLNNYT